MLSPSQPVVRDDEKTRRRLWLARPPLLTKSVLVSLIEIGKMRKRLNDQIGGATVAAAAEASQ